MFGTPAPEPEEDPDAEPYHNADDQQLREAEPDIAPAENAEEAENSGGAAETDIEKVEVGGAPVSQEEQGATEPEPVEAEPEPESVEPFTLCSPFVEVDEVPEDSSDDEPVAMHTRSHT